jgi:hypothetical protein
MIRQLGTVLAVGLLAGACVGHSQPAVRADAAQAGPPRTTVKNKRIKLDFASSLNPDCSSPGLPIVTVLEQPKNGTVKIGKSADFTNFTQDNQRWHCNVRKTPGVLIEYVPNRDFSGTDTLTVDAIYPDGAALQNRYDLIVR